MKAAVFEGIGKIVYRDVADPTLPPGSLLVKVMACGICGGDVRNFQYGLKDGVTGQIMGHEIAGEVIGTDAEFFDAGERVALAPDVSCGNCYYCKRGLVNLCLSHKMLGTHYPGGFAQLLAVPKEILERGFIERIPKNMPFAYAAFAETAAAVIACQKRLGIGLGDRIAIIGDGPVGCLHTEVARAGGVEKIALIGMDKLALAEAFAPDHLLDNRRPETVIQAVRDMTEGIGADAVIVAVPSVKPLGQALSMVRKRGTVVIYGGVPKTDEIAAVNANHIHYNEISITGAFSYPRTGLADALSAIAAGKIHPERYIGSPIPLSDVLKGMKMIMEGQALKIILDPWMG